MKNTTNKMDESILVCVYYGPNGERLIKRGCDIARSLNCPLYILTVDPKPFDEFDAEKTNYIARWKEIADQLKHATFIMKDNDTRPISKVIASVARELGVTQIILGQTAQSRWEQLTKGSIINALLREIPFVDLHIVSVARYLKNDEEQQFEKGMRAYLVKEADDYRMILEYNKDVEFEGIFFKEIGTDFDSGIFKFMKDNQTLHVKVCQGKVRPF